MDLKLAVEIYRDQKLELEKLALKQTVLEEAIINYADSKLDMNRVLSNFTNDDFEQHMNSLMKNNTISNVSNGEICGKNWKTKFIGFTFIVNDIIFEVNYPVGITDVHSLDYEKFDKGVIYVMVDSTSRVKLEYFNNMVELAEKIENYFN